MSNLDFSFLLGQELGMLCFGPYTLTLHFDPGTQIQIEGEFYHECHGDRKYSRKYKFPIRTSHLTGLLSTAIESVKTGEDGKLTLRFSNKDTLVVEGRVGPYEAYNISYQAQHWFV